MSSPFDIEMLQKQNDSLQKTIEDLLAERERLLRQYGEKELYIKQERFHYDGYETHIRMLRGTLDEAEKQNEALQKKVGELEHFCKIEAERAFRAGIEASEALSKQNECIEKVKQHHDAWVRVTSITKQHMPYDYHPADLVRGLRDLREVFEAASREVLRLLECNEKLSRELDRVKQEAAGGQ